MISSELLLYRGGDTECAETLVVRVMFKQKCIFVALQLVGEDPSEEKGATEAKLRGALFDACMPRRCTPLRITNPVSTPIQLLETFSHCAQADAHLLLCNSREHALHALGLLNLRSYPEALAR